MGKAGLPSALVAPSGCALDVKVAKGESVGLGGRVRGSRLERCDPGGGGGGWSGERAVRLSWESLRSARADFESLR